MVFRKGFKDMFLRNKWKILRGDKVAITRGKDKGQVGTVLKVIRNSKFPRVIVEGLNLTKRHIKRTKDAPGRKISVESPLHYSNVALVDPVTNSPVRVCWRFLEDGTKVRLTRGRLASGTIVPRPDVLKQRRKPFPVKAGPQDTQVKDALKQTHKPGDLPSFLKAQLAQQQQHQQQRHFSSGGSGGFGLAVAAGSSRWSLLGGRPLLWRGFAASAW